jgi:coatomer subunit beta'
LIYTNNKSSVRTGQWVGDCFVYTNSTGRLNYLVGDQTYTISHFDSPHYVLGYIPRDGRVYVADKDVQIVSFALSLSVIEYQTLVLRGDLDAANEMLPDIPEDQKSKIARFLEGQGYKEQALEVATDSEHRFELALSLNQLDIALELAREADVEHKWKTVGDAALTTWNMRLAEECFTHAKDMGSLLLLYTSSCNEAGLRKLAQQADDAGARNVAFSCLWQVGDLNACIDLLVRTDRTAEAVLFAQTYLPSRAPEIAKTWKQGLESNGKAKVARLLGVPPTDGEGDADLFPEWDSYIQLEKEGGNKSHDLIDVGDEEEEEAEAEVEEQEEETAEDGVETEEAEADAAEEADEPASPQTETEV